MSLRPTNANVLVIACPESKHMDALSYFLSQQNWSNYDMYNLNGASMGVMHCLTQNSQTNAEVDWPIALTVLGGTGNGIYNSDKWFKTFEDHLLWSIQYHNTSEIWIFDHLDCKFYSRYMLPFYEGGEVIYPADDEETPHIITMNSFKQHYNSFFNVFGNSIPIKGFVIHPDGSITNPINDGSGIQLTQAGIKKHNYVMWAGVAVGVISFFVIFGNFSSVKKTASKASKIY